MKAYVKAFATFRTILMSDVLLSTLVVDSLDQETSSVTVVGTDIDSSMVGSWLLCDDQMFLIAGVKPSVDRTMLTLKQPIDAFARLREMPDSVTGMTVGGFVRSVLLSGWASEEDPVYAVPYLDVFNSDTAIPAILPEADRNNLYSLPAYVRLVRRLYGITVRFLPNGNRLTCLIARQADRYHQVSFSDGRSQISNVKYSADGIAKLTVYNDVETGRDADGNPIIDRQRSDWYLADDGTVSTDVPARRASGSWDTLTVQNADSQALQERVEAAFAKNKFTHKLEFYSFLDLTVGASCRFHVYGQDLRSTISYKAKVTGDDRYFYRSGELATTAVDKLKGLMNNER